MMRKKYGIRTHVAWLTLLPLLLMVSGLEAFFLHDRFVDMDHDLLTRGQLIARQLAAGSEYGVFSHNSAFVRNLAENVLKLPDVRSVVVLDASPEILVAAGEKPSALANVGDVRDDARKLLALVNREVFDNGSTLLLYQPILSTPVVLNEFEDKPAIRQAGSVLIEMNWAETHRQKSRLLWFTLLITAAFLLATSYLVQRASRRIIEPIRRLSEAIQSIGAGHLDTRVTQSSCVDELCTLTHGINQMSADLQHERDILQHRIDEATQQLRALAFYDTLTMLPNRRLLTDRLTQSMAASHRNGHYGALIFLDLDNFKPLNDQFGHAVGDMLLIEAARRISSCLREVDTVARFGGDEFVVLLGKLDAGYAESVSLAEGVAEKIRARLADTYFLKYQQPEHPEISLEHHYSSSIGVALFMNHDASQDEILGWADSAMYRAKKEGRNRICFHHAAGVVPELTCRSEN